MKPNDLQSNDLKGKIGVRRIINAAGYSKDGLQAAFRHEAAFRQLLVLNGVLILLAFWLDLESSVRMILIAGSFLSLIVELFNTGLEAIVDDISLDKRPRAKIAKDVGSAAQMLAMILLAILWWCALCD